MKRTAEEYRKILKAVLTVKIAITEDAGVYRTNKWSDEAMVTALNEGYIAGLKECLRVIEESDFLTEV